MKKSVNLGQDGSSGYWFHGLFNEIEIVDYMLKLTWSVARTVSLLNRHFYPARNGCLRPMRSITIQSLKIIDEC